MDCSTSETLDDTTQAVTHVDLDKLKASEPTDCVTLEDSMGYIRHALMKLMMTCAVPVKLMHKLFNNRTISVSSCFGGICTETTALQSLQNTAADLFGEHVQGPLVFSHVYTCECSRKCQEELIIRAPVNDCNMLSILQARVIAYL